MWNIHVDDFCCIGPEENNMKLLKELSKTVLLKISEPMRPTGLSFDEAPKHTLLSCERPWTVDGLAKRIYPTFVSECVELLGLGTADPVKAPSTKALWQTVENDRPLEDNDIALYRTCVGKLLYSSEEHIDSMYIIKELSRRLLAPCDEDMARLKHLVRYLSARDRVFNTCSGINDGKITVWTDSDWAGCKTSRKSTDGVLCMFGGSVVYASSKTQAFVAQSSEEAETAGIHRGGLVGVFCQISHMKLDSWELSPLSSEPTATRALPCAGTKARVVSGILVSNNS